MQDNNKSVWDPKLGKKRPFKKGVVAMPGLCNGGPKHELAPGVTVYCYFIDVDDILRYYRNDVDFAVSELRRKTGINYVFDETTRVSVPI